MTTTYIYLDNFRGFSDATIPIKQVNFLVGENSTGKTSVLGIINLISMPNFWFQQDFNTDEFKFGTFKDMASVNSDNGRFFSIGFFYCQEKEKNKEEESATAFLATFRDVDGQPRLHRLTYLKGGGSFEIKVTVKHIYYRAVDENIGHLDNSGVATIFRSWLKSHFTQKSSGYHRLPKAQDLPLAILISIIDSVVRKKAKTSDSIPFVPRPIPLSTVVWVAPIRAQPQRTYDSMSLNYSHEGGHTPYLIKKILDSSKEADTFLDFIKKVGSSSGLFDTIHIHRYGRGGGAPFEVDIVLDKQALSVSNVGYGVSQSLPVVVEVLVREEGTWFSIQQPEVHLHPRAQAALGDLFFEMAVKENKRFLIETHSDFTIDRFRMNYRRVEKRPPESQVLFFERVGGGNVVSSVAINENGELSRDQPESYRRFFLKEQLDLLDM